MNVHLSFKMLIELDERLSIIQKLRLFQNISAEKCVLQNVMVAITFQSSFQLVFN